MDNIVIEEVQSTDTQNSTNKELEDIKEQHIIEDIQISDSNNDNQEGLSLDFGDNDNQEGLSLDFGDNDNQNIEANNIPLEQPVVDLNLTSEENETNKNIELNPDNIPESPDYQSDLHNESSLFETLGFNPIGDALDLGQESANKNTVDEIDHKMENFIADNTNQDIENNSIPNDKNEQEANNTELENLLLNHPQNNIFSQNNASAETIITDINLRKESHARSQGTNLFDSNLDVKWSETAVEPRKKINFDTDNIPTSVNYQSDLGNKENLIDTFGFKPVGDALDLDQATYNANTVNDSDDRNEEYNNELDEFRGSDTIIDKNVSSQEQSTPTKKKGKNLSNLKSSGVHHSRKVKLQGNYTSHRSRYLEEAHKKSEASNKNTIILIFLIIAIIVILCFLAFRNSKNSHTTSIPASSHSEMAQNSHSEMAQDSQDNAQNPMSDKKKTRNYL